jgi:hypothetical protein
MGQIFLTRTWIRGESRLSLHSTSPLTLMPPSRALELQDAENAYGAVLFVPFRADCPEPGPPILAVVLALRAFILTPARSAYLRG